MDTVLAGTPEEHAARARRSSRATPDKGNVPEPPRPRRRPPGAGDGQPAHQTSTATPAARRRHPAEPTPTADARRRADDRRATSPTTPTPAPTDGGAAAGAVPHVRRAAHRGRRSAEPADRGRQTERVSTTPTGPSVPADQPGDGPEVSAAPVSTVPQVAAPPWPDRVVPTWTDPVAVQASEAVGGPWGRHAVTGRALFWTPLRVCLLFTVLVLSLAWIKQAPCADGNWSGSRSSTRTSATPTPSRCSALHGLSTGQVPYLDSPVEYPVLTGGLMQLAAAVARGYDSLAARRSGCCPDPLPVQSYYVVTCLLLSVCALVTTRAVLGLTGRRPWDAAMVGLSPLLLVHAFTNWDLLAVALTALGMWAWARRRPVLAGVLLGLGIAAKLYPLLVARRAVPAVPAGRAAAAVADHGGDRRPGLAGGRPADRGPRAGQLGPVLHPQRHPPGQPGEHLGDRAALGGRASSTARWPRASRRRCSTRPSPSCCCSARRASGAWRWPRRCGRGSRSWRSCWSRRSCC